MTPVAAPAMIIQYEGTLKNHIAANETARHKNPKIDLTVFFEN